jgi:hypothetical protein
VFGDTANQFGRGPVASRSVLKFSAGERSGLATQPISSAGDRLNPAAS